MTYFNIDYTINNIKTHKKNEIFLYLMNEDVLYKEIEEVREFLDNNEYRYEFHHEYNALNNIIFNTIKDFHYKIENGIEPSKEEIIEIIDKRNAYLLDSSKITYKDVMEYWNSLIEEYKANIHKSAREIRIHPQVPIFRDDNNVIGYWDIVIDLVNNYINTPNFTFWYGKEEKGEYVQKIYIIIEDTVDDIIEVMRKIKLYRIYIDKKDIVLASKKNDYIELFKKHDVRCIII